MIDRHGMLWVWMVAVAAVSLTGCGKSGDPGTQPAGAAAVNVEPRKPAAPQATDPAGAVSIFLDAVRRGDDEKTAAMFTPAAREKVTAMGVQVAPPGSDTAKFEVGKVEYFDKQTARVESSWTDLDQDGKPRTDAIVWMVRQDQEGWRVAGMETMVFPGEPTVMLDFERPEETMKKLETLKEEIRRREGEAQRQAQRPEESANSLQR